jgi:SAM-dependent methyltransferase
MKNLLKKFRIYSRSLKRKTIGLSYGATWQGQNNDFYEKMHEHGIQKNKDFVEYFKNKKNIKTVLEIGCGTGIFPIKYFDLFKDKEYTGMDISKSAIAYCKKHSKFTFLCGDFLKMQLSDTYDLIFSHGVINHVPDIDLFLKKTLDICKKYAYINASHGYFPDLESHKMIWAENQAIYNTDISVKQLKRTLLNFGLNDDEFIIRPQGSGSKASTVVEIDRKNLIQ